MRAKVTVTFEYEFRQPDTRHFAVEAASAATAISRAVRLAQKEIKPRMWTSVVAVLEKRDPVIRVGAATAEDILNVKPVDAIAA